MSVREYYLKNKEVFQVPRRKFSPQNVETPFATLIPFQHFATPYRAWLYISQLLWGDNFIIRGVYIIKNFLTSLLVSCAYLGILALILVFGFGRELLAAYERSDWLWIGIFAAWVISGWIGSKIADKSRKK